MTLEAVNRGSYEGPYVHGRSGIHRPLVDRDAAELLSYPIREILAVVDGLIRAGIPRQNFLFANIGDPNANGWELPSYAAGILQDVLKLEVSQEDRQRIGQLVSESLQKNELTPENIVPYVLGQIQSCVRLDDRRFGYAPSIGLPETRDWVVRERRKKDQGSQLQPDNVIWTNGGADGLHLIRSCINRPVRIASTAPGYPATISYEAALSQQDPILFKLKKGDSWQPDFDDLFRVIRENERCLGGIAITRIGNNPTGSVLTNGSVLNIVELCAKYGLFIEDDATYENLLPRDVQLVSLTAIAREYGVPVIVHRSASKDLCLPGLRAGWMEFHEHNGGPYFSGLIDMVKQAVTARVGSGILGQMLVPQLYDHPDFGEYNAQMIAELQKSATEMANFFNQIPGMYCTVPTIPFYVAPCFEKEVLNNYQRLPISDDVAREYVEDIVAQPNKCHLDRPDERLAIYLAAGDDTHIVVPQLSGFKGPDGVRFVALNRDPAVIKKFLERFRDAVGQYLGNS